MVTLWCGSQWHDWQKTEHAGSLASHYMGGEEHLLQWKQHRETVVKFIKLLPHFYSFPNYTVFIFFQVKFNRLKTTHTYLLNSYYSFFRCIHFFVFIHCYLTVIMGVQLLILRLSENICILPLWWMKLG